MANKYWVNGTGNSNGETNWTSVVDATVAKATSRYYSDGYCAPWWCIDPNSSLIGTYVGNGWMSTTNTNQKLNFNLESAKIINRIYYEGWHNSGGNTTRDAKTYALYGSNTVGDFNDVTWANNPTVTMTLLSSGTLQQHTAGNVSEPFYIDFNNTTAYQYYLFRFTDNWGDATYMGMRRIEFRTMHWATISGGTATYANIPASSDNITIDSNSASNWFTASFNDEQIHDFTYSNSFAMLSGSIKLSGSLTVNNTLNVNGGIDSFIITMNATSGTEIIRTNTNMCYASIIFDGSGGTFQLYDDILLHGSLTLTAGTFDANSKTVQFSIGDYTASITGSFTFYNLSFGSVNGYLKLASSITISNNFSITSGEGINTFYSTDINNQKTITVNGTISASRARFGGINLQGTASPLYCDATCGEIANNTNILLIGTKTWVKG